MDRLLCAIAFILASNSAALADQYPIPTDSWIACVNWEDGQPVWTSKPGILGPPTIRASDEIVVVESKLPKHAKAPSLSVHYRLEADTGRVLGTTFLDPESGKPIEGAPRLPPLNLEASEPLEPLPRNLVSSHGTRFDFKKGYTRHLVAVDGDDRQVVRELETFPSDLHVVENLAMYTFGSGELRSIVFAYDLQRESLVWEFDPSDELDEQPASAADISVDDDRLLVAVDQSIFALSLKSGEVLWKSSLPRQEIRRFDSPWTTFGRVEDRLIVACYEDLFILRREDGKLLWSVDCGRFGQPWPTIRDGRVYVAVRNVE